MYLMDNQSAEFPRLLHTTIGPFAVSNLVLVAYFYSPPIIPRLPRLTQLLHLQLLTVTRLQGSKALLSLREGFL